MSRASATSSWTPSAPREWARTSWSSLAMRARSSSAMALARSCWARRWCRRCSANRTVHRITAPRTTIASRGWCHQIRLAAVRARSTVVTATMAVMVGVTWAANRSNAANRKTVGAACSDPDTDAATAEPPASSAATVLGAWRSRRTKASQQAMDAASADHTRAGARAGDVVASDQARTSVINSLARRPVSGSSAASSRTTRARTSRMA
ncbi:hypothetical protein ACFQYP_12645 [Nonomuraea antimicrobica]